MSGKTIRFSLWGTIYPMVIFYRLFLCQEKDEICDKYRNYTDIDCRQEHVFEIKWSESARADRSDRPQLCAHRCQFIAQVGLNLHFGAVKTIYITSGLSPAWLTKAEVNRANLLIEQHAHLGNSIRHLYDLGIGVMLTQTDGPMDG